MSAAAPGTLPGEPAGAGTGPVVAGRSHALLADGSIIEIRPAGEADAGPVLAFYQALSPANRYLRFFSLSKHAAAQEARRVCRPPDSQHAALLAVQAGRIVGVASYEPASSPATAEVAFAVADDMHGRGIATLLLEHLVSIGRARHLDAFRAETLAENTAMLRVFADAGLSVRRTLADGVVELTMPIPRAPALTEPSAYADAVAARESRADVASLRPLLAPRSVVVIGASRRPGTVGRSILRNILTAGYRGRVYAVNPNARELDGIPCLPAVTDLPEAPDLAVVAVPPAGVPDVAEECGQRGARGLVVITSALTPAQGSALLAACREHSMRLVGPNCFGLAVPAIGLDATFAAAHPAAGTVGLVMQSGGLGFALLQHLTRLGAGISSFASVGDKYDVSSNDLLTWWEQDSVTRMAVLYVDSFGNPRKFARTARRVGRAMPVLTVYAGGSGTTPPAGGSQAAAVATPAVTAEALFRQAGIIATRTLGELLDVAALLASQPAPASHEVALVSNVDGAGALAADACTACGLSVRHPSPQAQRRLARLIPSGGSVTGPVDTTAAIPPGRFRRCLEVVAADEGVGAVLALVLSTAVNDLLPAVCGARVPVTLAAVVLDQAEGVRLVAREPDGGPEAGAGGRPATLPAYAYPESAARALGHAARYRAWRAEPPGTVAPLPGLRPAQARALVTSFLERLPGGGWLPPETARELLGCYGLRLAAAGAEGARGPGGQGVEVIIGLVADPVFGPLVVFGLGGPAVTVLGDHTALLAPLTSADAEAMIRSVRAAPLLLGQRDQPAVDTAALADILQRVSRLGDDLPQVAELELNPVIARPDGALPVAARVRVTSREWADPFLRRLREPAGL
jgi:acyl-CoA synthetase (NDP forming)/GNAT superfamily N-acetyltransferase